MKKALVLSIVCAFGLGAAGFAQGTLSGSWASSMCLNPQTPQFTSFSSVLTVDYAISGWTFETVAAFSMTGWKSLVFNVDGVLGAFTLSSYLDFIPALGCMGEWYTNATVNIAGVSLTFETVLSDSIYDACGAISGEPWYVTNSTPIYPIGSAQYAAGWYNWDGFGAAITVEGGAADLTFMSKVYLNSFMADLKSKCGNLTTRADTLKPSTQTYCFCFDKIEFELTFPFCCIELVDVTFGFNRSGFAGINFCVEDVTFPNLPWMAWDVCISFFESCDPQTVGKTLTITPSLNLGDYACFTVYADLCSIAAGCYGGINIYAIGIECDFNGCTFSDISIVNLADTTLSHWQLIDPYATAVGGYWEKFCISCGGDSCCGGAFAFDVCTYFLQSSSALFDWGKTDISLSFGISSNFDLTSSLSVTSAGFVSLCFGFTVNF